MPFIFLTCLICIFVFIVHTFVFLNKLFYYYYNILKSPSRVDNFEYLYNLSEQYSITRTAFSRARQEVCHDMGNGTVSIRSC